MPQKLRAVKPEDSDEPIGQYAQQVTMGSTSSLPYERLMIYYRKNKMYSEELDVIDKGISSLKQFYSRHQKHTLGNRNKPSIKQLSDRINRSMGLHDKKGNELFLPEPLPRWMKRREVVLKKIARLDERRKKKVAKSNTTPSATKKKQGKTKSKK